jgi:bleomycin hydrolase
MTDFALTPTELDKLSTDFSADPQARLMQNAVTTTDVHQIAMDRRVVTALDTSMSDKLDTWGVANQKKSGRCWLFSGLNFLRSHVIDELKLDSFELSQNYLHFWDKLEKANWFLTSMIELADKDLDDRTIHQLLSDPIGDGGQWDMFVSLVLKYGVVPKYAMPETESSSNTKAMNTTLETLLRRGGRDLRAAVATGADADALRRQLVAEVYRVLSIHLGTPPTSFLWQYRDKDKNFKRVGTMTPQEFAKKYIDADLTQYVCLVNDPRTTSPYGSVLTVDHLGNVVGGRPVTYLNAPADLLSSMVCKAIQDGRPVWFGCDCGKQFDRVNGYWSAALFDFAGVYGVDMAMGKAERMEYGEEAMNHAMLFTGVDMVDGAARRYRVENSWGDDRSDKGFDTMDGDWFAEHVFEVAVPLADLPKDWRAKLDGATPIVLPLWDPMGSLAD